MFQKMKKLLALVCVLALAVTALPPVSASAAAVPKFKTTYASIYENGVNKGKYTYTLQNLKKGQRVDWSVSGAGKFYVTVKTASKKATGTTMSNVITVQTSGKTAAKNKQITLKAKIYSAAGKLQSTVSTKATIKIKPTAVTITAPAEADDLLLVGSSYTFAYKVTPVNATSTNTWTVTAEDGQDVSSYISSTGVFTPLKAGIYTIRASANIGTKTIKSATCIVEVADYMTEVEQTAANKIKLSYSGDVKAQFTVSDFAIQNAAGAGIVVKEVSFSDDGTSAVLTTYSNLQDGTTYTISDGQTSKSFKASVGTPVRVEILTKEVTVKKATAITYALYDQNGVDVTAVYPGTVTYDGSEVTNGMFGDDDLLTMSSIGKNATIRITYTSKADPNLILKASAVVVCVAASTAVNTNFTITETSADPDYTAAGYADNRKVSIGSTGYVHFRAQDADQTVIKYSALKYESSDPDTLIVASNGKVTPIKSGTVKIIVTATYADEAYTYSYDVTIAEASYLKSIQLSTSSVSMSNVYNSDYQKYIEVSALDQFGESFPLTTESAAFTNNSTIKASLASYDAALNRIVLRTRNATPGTYYYTLTLTAGTHQASADFALTVSAVPSTGTISYEIEIDRTSDDLTLNTDVSGTKYVNVRLAQYRGGVFTNYATFTNATVTRDNLYYGNDLTSAGTTSKQTISASNRLALKTLDITGGVCKKAETGTYSIALQYYSSESKSYVTVNTSLTLTDTQDASTLTIERLTSSKTCANALELAVDCLRVNGAVITECVVTGETQSGSRVSVKSGDQVNIKSVTVTETYTIAAGQTVTMTYELLVGKTLTNN